MWRTEFEGRLGKDPEMRYIADGTPVTSFPVAVNFQEKGQRKPNGSIVLSGGTWLRMRINN